jgi:hypothetical protein
VVLASAEGPEWAQGREMPLTYAKHAGKGHDHETCFFLPWVLPGIMVS